MAALRLLGPPPAGTRPVPSGLGRVDRVRPPSILATANRCAVCAGWCLQPELTASLCPLGQVLDLHSHTLSSVTGGVPVPEV